MRKEQRTRAATFRFPQWGSTRSTNQTTARQVAPGCSPYVFLAANRTAFTPLQHRALGCFPRSSFHFFSIGNLPLDSIVFHTGVGAFTLHCVHAKPRSTTQPPPSLKVLGSIQCEPDLCVFQIHADLCVHSSLSTIQKQVLRTGPESGIAIWIRFVRPELSVPPARLQMGNSGFGFPGSR